MTTLLLPQLRRALASRASHQIISRSVASVPTSSHCPPEFAIAEGTRDTIAWRRRPLQSLVSPRKFRIRWGRPSFQPRCFSSPSGGGESGDASSSAGGLETVPLSSVGSSDLELAAEAAAGHEPGQLLSDLPGTTAGKGRRLAIVFTCSVCSTRSAKKFSEQAYRKGVVMVRCPGCQNLHLISDQLGFFSDDGKGGWDIETALAERGDEVRAVTDDNVLELTLADLVGTGKLEELRRDDGGEAKEEDR